MRSAGVLLAISSLPSPYGIGTLGKEAYHFVDFLVAAGQRYWQILPIGPTGFGNSPYQSLSSYAGNPYYIDFDMLVEDGLLTKKEIEDIAWGKEGTIDYGLLYQNRYAVLKKATDRLPLVHPEDYFSFLEKESYWLQDYAIYMAIKQDQNGKSWQTWPKELRDCHSPEVFAKAKELQEEVLFYERIQYLFYTQYQTLKEYATKNGIQIIGDLPFYVAEDSIDVWSHPEQFDLDEDHKMRYVSGMGPDCGCPEGQKWGNPLFDWQRQREEGYHWWMERAEHAFRFCDVLRLDHFQGYDTCFAIPFDGTPAEGCVRQGPGLEVFHRLEEAIGKKEFIVEDLGQLTPEFMEMVKESGFPGMRILEYAFDPNDPGSIYNPWQYEKNSVAYTGTHDNNTLAGMEVDPNEQERVAQAKEYLGISKEEGFVQGMLRGVWASSSDMAIIPMQDLLGLGSEARMNDPTGKTPCWSWRLVPDYDCKELAARIKHKMKLYCR